VTWKQICNIYTQYRKSLYFVLKQWQVKDLKMLSEILLCIHVAGSTTGYIDIQTAGDISYLCTYDLYSSVCNVYDACRIDPLWGRGLSPRNPKQRRVFLGPKNSWFPGPNPLPLAQVMDLHASKIITYMYTLYNVQGRINHRCILVLFTRATGDFDGLLKGIVGSYRGPYHPSSAPS
jgi:hypothetical protein